VIRVFVADDHAIVREGLVRLIEGAADMTPVGSAGDSDTVVQRARGEEWDVLVLDLSLPGAGGVEVFEQLRASKPTLPIVIFTMHPEDRYAVRLLRGGAAAYINKARPPTEVLEAIRKAAQGGRYVTQSVGELLLEGGGEGIQPHETLTDREYQIFLLLLEGKAPSDIAKQLFLSMSTVSTHIRRVKDKLGAESSADLVRYAFRAGLIEL
jgi:DNA-binding NarL/FixJ family response regulator